MNVPSDEGLETTEEKDSNYECFGWWLSDILSKPFTAQLGNLKSEDDSGICFEKHQLASDESLTSGSQWDKSDLNEKVSGLEAEIKCQNKMIEENVTNKNKRSLLTIARSKLKHRKPKILSNVENPKDDPTKNQILAISDLEYTEKSALDNQEQLNVGLLPKTQLLALMNPDSPNSKHLAAVLFDIPVSSTIQPPLEHVTNPKTLYEISKNQKTNKVENCAKIPEQDRLQQYSAQDVSDVLEDLVQTVEHEARDKDLEESRGIFLKTVSGLDMKLRYLETDIQQLHTDANDLYSDFQMQEEATSRITKEARDLVEDLQNLRYLDDLIFLLQGQLDRITLRKWPFILAHVLPQKDSSHEINLVV